MFLASVPIRVVRTASLAVLLFALPASADQPALPDPFTSEGLVRAVLARHPSSAAASASVDAARARTEAAGSFDDPMLSYSLAPLSLLPSAHGRVGQTVRLSQRLPFFGKRAAARDLASAEATMEEAERATVHERLALIAAERFSELYSLHHALRIHREHRALLSDMRASAEGRYRAGMGPQHAVLEAEMALAELDADELMHEGMRQAVVAELNALLRRPPGEDLPTPVIDLRLVVMLPNARAPDSPSDRDHHTHGSKPAPGAGGEPPPAALPRPELAAMRAEERRMAAALEQAERESFPDLELMAEYSSMWEHPDHRLMVGVMIELPIQFGRRRAMRDEATAMLARSRHELQRMEDEVRSEQAAAASRLVSVRGRVDLQRRRVLPLAKSRVDSIRAAYLTGQADLGEVLDAERAQRSAEIALHESLAELLLRDAQVRRAEGTLAPAPEMNR